VQIAALKAKYKEFGTWFIKSLGYENLQLDKFEVEMKVYMPTRRRADIDNHCSGFAKLIFDSFTETGFIVDDDYLHLTKITMSCGYDKDNPRSEIIINTIEE